MVDSESIEVLGLIPYEDCECVTWGSILIDVFRIAIEIRKHYHLTKKTPLWKITKGYFTDLLFWDGIYLYQCRVDTGSKKNFETHFVERKWEVRQINQTRNIALKRAQVTEEALVAQIGKGHLDNLLDYNN